MKAFTNHSEELAKGLGWFSITLGVAELLAPQALARLIGVEERPTLFRALGLREITSGLGILSQDRPAGWMWSRVAGDVMDLSLLGIALASDDSDREKVGAATAAMLGATVVDAWCAWQLSTQTARGVHLSRTITIDRSREDLYRFWRDFENLPRFMRNLEAVQVADGTRSHWIAQAPMGATVEWDAEIIQDQPNTLIAWRSLPDADVKNAGSVRFETAPGGHGTVVTVQLQYEPPGGSLGATIAKIFGKEPDQEIQTDLFRFKHLMETGAVALEPVLC